MTHVSLNVGQKVCKQLMHESTLCSDKTLMHTKKQGPLGHFDLPDSFNHCFKTDQLSYNLLKRFQQTVLQALWGLFLHSFSVQSTCQTVTFLFILFLDPVKQMDERLCDRLVAGNKDLDVKMKTWLEPVFKRIN